VTVNCAGYMEFWCKVSSVFVLNRGEIKKIYLRSNLREENLHISLSGERTNCETVCWGLLVCHLQDLQVWCVGVCWCAACRIYRCGVLGCAGVLPAESTGVVCWGVLVCCLQNLQVWCVGVCWCAACSSYRWLVGVCRCAVCRIYRCGVLGCAGVMPAASTGGWCVLVCCLQDLQLWCVGVCCYAARRIYRCGV
jgi:hypothetical protein